LSQNTQTKIMRKLLSNKMERSDGGLTEFTTLTLTEITELNHKTLVKMFGDPVKIQTAIFWNKIQKLNFLIRLELYFATLFKFIMRSVQLKCVQ